MIIYFHILETVTAVLLLLTILCVGWDLEKIKRRLKSLENKLKTIEKELKVLRNKSNRGT